MPLTVRGRTVGVLRVYLEDVAVLRSEDIQLLKIVADLGALALEKIQVHFHGRTPKNIVFVPGRIINLVG